MVQEVDLCLSSPEECSSGNATPKGAQLGTPTMLADVDTQVEVATPPSPSAVANATHQFPTTGAFVESLAAATAGAVYAAPGPPHQDPCDAVG